MSCRSINCMDYGCIDPNCDWFESGKVSRNATNRIRVRECKSKSKTNKGTNKRGPKNWRVEIPVDGTDEIDVLIYKHHRWAILNADRLARGLSIRTHGLVGTHTEKRTNVQSYPEPTY